MGRQCTKAIFVGTCANLNGYVDDGKPVARLVDRKDRRQAGALAASKAFGKVSKAAAVEWGKIPQGMRRLGGEAAFNEWVSACHALRNEGSYYWDWSQLEGMVFGDGAGSSGSRSEFGDFVHGEGEDFFDSEGIRCWEAPSRTATVAGIRFGKLDFSTGLASVRRALKPYREGVDAQWRLGAMPRRDGHYDLGAKFNPYRGPAFFYEGDARDRAWNAKHAKGVYKGYEPEYFDHGWGLAGGRFGRGHTVWGDWGGVDGPRMPKRWVNFRAPQQKGVPLGKGAFRVRFWLQVVVVDGRMLPWACTDWCNLDAWAGPALDLTDLRGRLVGLAEDKDILVFAGVEVSEKRVRHWVRLPWACGLSLVAVGSVAELREQAVAIGGNAQKHRLGRLAVRASNASGLRVRHGKRVVRHWQGP